MAEKVLQIPQELERLYKLREKLANTDRDDHLDEVNHWEKKIKRALIFLNLQKHEGITDIISKANLEIESIDEILKSTKPLDLSPEGALKYTYETANLFNRREIWTWFKALFEEAETDLKEAEAFLEGQEAEPDEDEA